MVVSWLVRGLLFNSGFVSSPISPEACLYTGVADSPWTAAPTFDRAPCQDTPEAQDAVLQYLRIAEKGGSDVRLDLNLPFRPKAWPRAGLQAKAWRWKVVHGFKWEDARHNHINALELRAALSAFKWRTRHSSF